MTIEFRQMNPGHCKTWLLSGGRGTECAIVDPVLERLEEYLSLVEAEKLRLSSAIDTHTHADHISACASLRDVTGCDYVMHSSAPAGCVSVRLSDGDRRLVAGAQARVMHTPGHTADSMCLVFDDRVLTGDTLFLDEGGAGRDDLQGGDPDAHFESLQRLKALPDHLLVCPAHDYRGREPSTLANQRSSNPHLRIASKQEFREYLSELRLGPADWMKNVLQANYACALDPDAAWIPADSWACEIGGATGKGANEGEVVMVTGAQALGKIRGGGVLVLDVREPRELRGPLGAISGAMNVPVSKIAGSIGDIRRKAANEILVVCKSGPRSHTAARVLQQAGLKRVSMIDGGMIAWQDAGLPLDPIKGRR